MPSQVLTSVENNFSKGLVTEFTGLNFPENAATDCDNVEFTLIGDVKRRLGIEKEYNAVSTAFDRTGRATNTFKWDNAGGDGNTQIIAVQVGSTIVFYKSSDATVGNPISNQYITQIQLAPASNGTAVDETKNCEFAVGNGYLFCFHPGSEPAFFSYNPAAPRISSVQVQYINVQIRDMGGYPEYPYISDDTRPSSPTVTGVHIYNLINQGWTQGNSWGATSTSTVATGTGAKVFTVAAGITGIAPGQTVQVQGFIPLGTGLNTYNIVTMTGVVAAYAGTNLTITVSAVAGTAGTYSIWNIVPIIVGYINTFVGATGNYPSNSDQWWRFKNASGVFDPATTLANVTIGGPSPKGHVILQAFTQYRYAVTGQSGPSDIATTIRPSNGCWFQGRLWMTGVNASSPGNGGITPFYTWSENIYFSQVAFKTEDFGKCYQLNDPTSDTLFDLLPTDGGVIVIPGSGAIYKLFPIQNGLLVFAANGVWFITGSTGIGFSATDYTITKISNVQSISSTSFVDVLGLPYFWNEEGVYHVAPVQGGGLQVASLTFDTLASFYEDIPLEAKKFARGAYHPLDYTVQWVYKSTNSTSTVDKFAYDRMLTFNTYNKAFYPYSVPIGEVSVNGIIYYSGPGGSTTISPGFKYWSSFHSGAETFFSEFRNNSFLDWTGTAEEDYDSYFITGYKLHGQGWRKFQTPYIYMYNRLDTDVASSVAYNIQGIWDYAADTDSNRWSQPQFAEIYAPHYSNGIKRHRIRGKGIALQIKVSSSSGRAFDIIGWSVYENVNSSV